MSKQTDSNPPTSLTGTFGRRLASSGRRQTRNRDLTQEERQAHLYDVFTEALQVSQSLQHLLPRISDPNTPLENSASTVDTVEPSEQEEDDPSSSTNDPAMRPPHEDSDEKRQ